MKIVAYMDYKAPTGFSSAAENIFRRIAAIAKNKGDKLDVVIIATNYGDQPSDTEEETDFMVLNPKEMGLQSSHDYLFRETLIKLIHGDNLFSKCDILFMMNDLPIIEGIMRHISKAPRVASGKLKVVGYFPVDSSPAQHWVKHLSFLTQAVTYTTYGIEELMNILPAKQVKEIKVIPHGVTANHSSLTKLKARRKFNLPSKKIIWGTVNKNSPRKDIGTLMLAFKMFLDKLPLKERSSHLLYIHAHPKDPTGVDIKELGDRLGLAEGAHYHLPLQPKFDRAGYTREDMADLYKSFDVFVTTTRAEGWGLTVTEAIAAKLPIVAPLHTSLKDILGEIGWPVIKHKQLTPMVVPNDGGAVRFQSNPVDFSNDMLIMAEKLKKGGEIDYGIYDQVIERFNWDRIAKSWYELFTFLKSQNKK